MPSPRGVRVASGWETDENGDRYMVLPSPRGVRVASGGYTRSIVTAYKWYRTAAKEVAVPARGAGCIEHLGIRKGHEVRSCRPREGCGLHQQKDTNPYQHICRFHTTRRLSITQGQQKMQGVLCLLYRKRECNLIVGSANRLFLRDKNAREKQRLAGNC